MRSGAAAVAFDGRLYVIGGQHELHHSESVICYDPATDAWTDPDDDTLIPNLPRPRHSMRAVVGEGRVLLIGGAGGPLECDLTAARPRWREFPELPTGGVVHPGVCAVRL